MALPPAVILVGSSAPAPGLRSGDPPLAFRCLGDRTLAEHAWAALADAGWAAPANVFVASNALQYKYFEHWSFGKGIDITHVLNSGRSLGDARVDCTTVMLALRAVLHAHPGRDCLVLAADAAPAEPGAAFAASLWRLAGASASSLLLQPSAAAAAAAVSAEAEGPCITVLTASPTSAAAGAELPVLGLVASTAGVASSGTGAAGAFASPIAYYLKAADVAMLAGSGVGGGGVAATGRALAALAPSATASSAASAAGAAAERVVPVECLPLLLTREGRCVVGLSLASPFAVGAFDGRLHALAESAAAAGAESPYTHRLPAQLVPGLAVLTAAASVATASAAAGGAAAVQAGGSGEIHARAYARVGLLGNPSDGYGGKTLAVTVANFCAEAWVTSAPPGAGITLVPHPIYDPLHFSDLSHLSTLAGREGYSGGVRLMMAALHRLRRHCAQRGVALPLARGFFVRYHTSVPRQVGLAGSSAIITAFLRAVMRFYGFGDEAAAAAVGLSRDLLPNFVLAIESEELGITAGLQDRVVQAYEGCVHMDFSQPEAMAAAGGAGAYTRVPTAALPPLFLAYAADPKDSGRMHAPVKQRWLAGDTEVVTGMKRIAALADRGLAVASARPFGGAGAGVARAREAVVGEWAQLMRENFDTRRSLFGDAALGKDNIRMIEIAREVGASGKFPGSGGAILGVVDAAGVERRGAAAMPPLCDDDAPAAEQEACVAARVAAATDALRAAYHAEGYVFVRLQPQEAGRGGAGVVE